MHLTVSDKTANGAVICELTMDVLTESITVRELIRSRIYQEVDDYNRRVRASNAEATGFNGLVVPTAFEKQLNPQRSSKTTAREIDWKKQFEVACDAFVRNGFFILVDDQQAEELDETITLGANTKVSFVKLMPLVGG